MFSLDNKINNRNIKSVTAWPIRLIQINVVTFYFAVSWHRINDPPWLNGKFAFFILNGVYSRFPYIDWVNFQPILSVLTYISWGLELFAPIFLIIKKTRSSWALLLISVHVFLLVFSTVTWYQYLLISLLLCFFLPSSLSKKILNLLYKIKQYAHVMIKKKNFS